MENNSPFDSFELQLTESAKIFIKEIAKWAKFLSIVGFIFLGFLVLGAIAMFASGGAMATMSSSPMGALGAAGGALAGIIYLLVALLYFFPIRYMYMFASKTKRAFESNDSQEMTDAFENLKSHYKFIGILTIIGLSFYALIFLLAIFGLAMQ